jgi:hypothetical protein
MTSAMEQLSLNVGINVGALLSCGLFECRVRVAPFYKRFAWILDGLLRART